MRVRSPDERPVEIPCMESGARDVEITRPGWAEGLGDWLRSGGRWRPAHGRDLPVESVELVQVSDLEPYVQGQRHLQQAWARHHDQEH